MRLLIAIELASAGLSYAGIGERLAFSCANNRRIIGHTSENFTNQRSEKLKRQVIVIGVKARLIPAFAKGSAIVKVGMPLVLSALIRVTPDMMRVIDHLKIAVFFDGPGALLPHERLEDGRRILVVVIRRVNVSDIVQQG